MSSRKNFQPTLSPATRHAQLIAEALQLADALRQAAAGIEIDQLELGYIHAHHSGGRVADIKTWRRDVPLILDRLVTGG